MPPTARGTKPGFVAALATMGSMGLNMQTGINGVYNLFDKDGYHYCVYGGTSVLKCFDDNDAAADVRIVASRNVADDLPADIARSVSRIIGLAMTYDGYLAAAPRCRPDPRPLSEGEVLRRLRR